MRLEVAAGDAGGPMNPRILARAIGALAVAAASAAALNARAESTQTVAITDASGFAEPMTAATAEVPASWRTQGGVLWNHGTNCVNNKVRVEWRARSRDDLLGFEIMPGYTWQVQGTQIQMNPCPAQPFRSAREFLEAVVQYRRAGARVLQYRDRPDMAAARAAQASAPANPQIRSRIDAGQVLIAYQSNGVEFREVVGTSVEFTELQGNIVGGSAVVFAHRAPNGRLDFAAGDRMAASFRIDKRWGDLTVAALQSAGQQFSAGQRRAIAQWHAKEMARINAQGAADRAAIRAQTSRDVAKIHADTYANTQATNDRIHRRNLEGIGEYNTYQDGGKQVRSSIHGGERVLRNPNGTYMSTNDPYFNPAGSRELQRVR
jgi:hypothetical protein